MPLQNFITTDICNISHLRGLKLAHPITTEDSFEISLLIGVDHYWDIVGSVVIRGVGPTAVQSKIGYLLSGPIPQCTTLVNQTSILHVLTSCKDDEQIIEQFWNLESMGIQVNEETYSYKQFLDNYQSNSVRQIDGKYCAKLPWKESHPNLPTNYAVAEMRTRQMVRRLGKNPDLLRQYSDIIREQKDRGFVEIASFEAKKEHYIPHHPVYKESATTPMRIVYDCSRKQSVNQPSLNDCLLPGPPVLNDLTSLLVRFRTHTYGIVTDIKKEFLNVALDEEDRDMTRFFWLSDPDDPESEFDIYRFKVDLFGATSSPFVLSVTLAKHLTKSDKPVAKILKRDIYVDNVVSGAASEDEAVEYYHSTRSVMLAGTFNLRSWSSNNSALQQCAAIEGVQDSSENVKILGLLWHISSDTLRYSPSKLFVSDIGGFISKRGILQNISRVYDPLGLLSPDTITAKILMHTLWLQKLDWDMPVSQEIEERWRVLAQDLEEAQLLALPRRYFGQSTRGSHETVELHIFTDASTKAYCAVAYIVCGENSALVMAKNQSSST